MGKHNLEKTNEVLMIDFHRKSASYEKVDGNNIEKVQVNEIIHTNKKSSY